MLVRLIDSGDVIQTDSVRHVEFFPNFARVYFFGVKEGVEFQGDKEQIRDVFDSLIQDQTTLKKQIIAVNEQAANLQAYEAHLKNEEQRLAQAFAALQQQQGQKIVTPGMLIPRKRGA